jgi:3-oxoacyl-[acyl-carrier protein] reductase
VGRRVTGRAEGRVAGRAGRRVAGRAGRRVALVTGGTRGIGLASARALAAEGWNLALCGVREQEAVRGELQSLTPAAVLYLRADIGEEDAADRLVQAVDQRFGRLDLLVNNAGVAPRERKDILEATRESFDRLLRINLRGPYFLTQAAARYMLRRPAPASGPRGCIVFIGSISATVASTNRGEYCISKAGLAMASLLWASRLAQEGIAVYEVRPGIIKTDMTAGAAAKYDRLIAEGLTLQRRWGTPEDVGRAVAMLARGELAYSTGQVLMVDGGMSVRRL